MSDGQIWRLKVRRLTDEKSKRFHDVAGGSNALYGADGLTYGAKATLSESEFDALVARQAAPAYAHCATGGTDGAKETRWIARIALASAVLVTYDPDPAGDERATWWLSRLKNAARLRPVGGDVTTMHCAGNKLGPWLDAAFSQAAPLIAQRAEGNAPEAETAQHEDVRGAPVPLASCFFCAAPSGYLDREGRPWCAAHAPTGAICPGTGEVYETGRREMSLELGVCYWCGDPLSVIDRHNRAWCARHAPGVFDGHEDAEETETEKHYTNEEILEKLKAALIEVGATFPEGGIQAQQATTQKTPARRALPDAPRCMTPHCNGSKLTPDALGNLWCELCALRREMINIGADLAGDWFPDMRWGSIQRTGEGEENWLMYAKGLAPSAVQMVLRACREETERRRGAQEAA